MRLAGERLPAAGEGFRGVGALRGRGSRGSPSHIRDGAHLEVEFTARREGAVGEGRSPDGRAIPACAHIRRVPRGYLPDEIKG